MHFLISLMVWWNDSIPTKHIHWGNVCNICERASFKIFAFSHSNTAISLNILLVYFRYFVSETYLISGVNILHIHIQSMEFPFITHGMVLNINDSIPTKHYHWENECVCERAKRASLENFGIFTFLTLKVPEKLLLYGLYVYYVVHICDFGMLRVKLLFISIFCRYIRCFVGTNDMLVGLHVPTNFSMYRQISKCTDKSPKRHYWGAIAPPPPCPPPPPLATLMIILINSPTGW